MLCYSGLQGVCALLELVVLVMGGQGGVICASIGGVREGALGPCSKAPDLWMGFSWLAHKVASCPVAFLLKLFSLLALVG